ncbi:hypothetical protein QTO34_007705 [Cnephaeus nilssonii]|uniref:Uncharacterized protein n=1 Tax=Cnephaeus nilssonii TaxID=3371016 RepID=A0AA40LFV8_CNENI|nr:hypothetical protein QTO34_007705 [Eptesicus nilssonii]
MWKLQQVILKNLAKINEGGYIQQQVFNVGRRNPRLASKLFKNFAKFTLPVLCKWKNKAWMIAHLFTIYKSPLMRHTDQKKKCWKEVVEIAKELELEVEPEDVTELLQSHDKTLWMRKRFIWMSK